MSDAHDVRARIRGFVDEQALFERLRSAVHRAGVFVPTGPRGLGRTYLQQAAAVDEAEGACSVQSRPIAPAPDNCRAGIAPSGATDSSTEET